MSTLARMAHEMAPELDRLINAYLNNGQLQGSASHTELESFLWENKIGILRVLQWHRPTPDYDYDGEATGCTNELYYRNGSTPEGIKTADAEYVKDTIKRCLHEAYETGRQSALDSMTTPTLKSQE